MRELITIDTGRKPLNNRAAKRGDFEALRMKRYLSMPDLSRTPGSPIAEIVQRI